MIIAATNTITIHAIPGKSEVIGALLNDMIFDLRDTVGCLSYAAVQSHSKPDLWLITAHWCTSHAMETHFHSPAQETYAQLMNLNVVRSIEFHCQSLNQ